MGIRHARLAAPGRPLGRRIGGVLAAALVAAPLSAIAPATAHADGPPVTVTPEAAALAQAQTTGKPVPVAADNTQNSTTVANPDGTLTYTDSPVPIQVDQGGTWVPVDATLQHNSNGSLSAKAAASGVTFSGGGSGPLATLTNAQGQQFSVTWPTSLPTPTISGATATYASVYPGVDLQMTAQTDGSYTEHLIVKSATAAANPALQNIHLTTSVSSGLTLGKNAAGGVQATNASGNPVFSSPTPTMWDSAPAPSSTTSSPSPSPSPSASGATAAVRSLATTSTTGSTGTSKDDANPVTDLGVTVSGNSVDIVPPAGSLTASGTVYPLVIDPSVGPSDSTGWTWVSSVNSGTSYWEGSNNTHDTYAHVGYDDWCSNGYSGCTAFGITRSMFEFPMTGLAGKHVTAATLSMTEQGATSSWSGSSQIDLHGGGAINSSTTWNNQNVWSAIAASANFPSVNSSTTGNANFDVTALIQQAVANGYQNQTMVLQAHNESDDTAYRYLIGNPTATNHPALSVTYWSTPNLPTNLSITNTGATTSCNTTAPGTWINKNDASTVTLGADLTGPDTGYAETADFWWHQVAPTNASTWSDLKGPTITAQSTPQPVSVTTPALSDGDEYQWQVYAQSDGGAYSSAAAPSGASCYFRTDFTPPTVSVTNSAPPTTVGASSGSLNLTATDAGTNPSGVAKINYNIDGTSINSGGTGEQSQTGSTAAITLPATSWGTHVVWYDTVDNAGNQSAPQHFDYYLADGSFTPGTAGDLDGDHKPDLAAIDAQGNVRYYSDPFANSPNATSGNPDGGAVMIPKTSAPNGTSFSGALIAHNGSFTGQTCDDVAVIESGGLYMATDNNNCSPTTSWTLGASQARPAVTNSLYNPNDWSSVQQAVMLPATSATNNKPALITLENYGGTPSLWMYTAVGSTFRNATLLASGSWLSDYTLMSPGLINGSPALWVRSVSTGALLQYTGVESWAGITAAPTSTTIATGGYRIGQYPSITSDGPEDGAGPTMWATNKAGRLFEIPTTVDTSNNVTLGTAVPVSTLGWAAGTQTLEGVKPLHPTSTIGLYRSSTNTFIFDTANNSTTVSHTLTLSFAQAGDIPVTGDWSGTGVDGVGVYRPSNSTFYLDDSNTVSELDHTIALGDPGDQPVVGDWNGDGITTIGVYRPSNDHFYLDDTLTSSSVDHVVWYGDSGDTPITGDWTGTGTTSIGVYRPGTEQFIPATSLTDTTALTAQNYGASGDTPITGDWTGSGSTGIGVWRSSASTFYLDNSVTSGTTNQSTAFGVSTDTPITGDWTGM